MESCVGLCAKHSLSLVPPLLACSLSLSLSLCLKKKKVHVEALSGFGHVHRPDSLNATSLSRLCSWGSSGNWESKQNARFKDKGTPDEPLISWVSLGVNL